MQLVIWDSFFEDLLVLSVKQTERGVRMTLFVTVRDLHVTASLPQFQQNDFSIERRASLEYPITK